MPLPKGTRFRVKQTSKGPVRLAFAKGTNRVIEAKKLNKKGSSHNSSHGTSKFHSMSGKFE